MQERLLVALDGSSFAERALQIAIDVAQQRQLEVCLLQAIQEDWEYDYADKYLRERLALVQASQIHCEHCILVGETVDVVAKESQSASLLFVASHGRSGFDRFALGSVTEKILRHAHCPVFVVRERAVRLREIKRVLVPLDGSELSLKAMPYACELCAATGGTLVLSRINEAAGFDLGLLSEEEEGEILNRYLSEVAESVDKSISVETIYGFGSASRSLLRQVEDQDIDLVVMASHGRSGFSRWVCGSVTENVVRASAAAVLVVRVDEGRKVPEF